jgi:hypothetical protein
MSFPGSGTVRFSDLQSVFGGVNPIAMSEYYADSPFGYTSGVGGIVNIGNPLKLSDFYGKSPLAPSPVLFYDPSNVSSYSGSGTTLYNVGTDGAATGTTGTMTNVSFDSTTANGVLDFNGGAYITFGQYNFPASMTAVAWVYPRSRVSINTLMANAGPNQATNGFKLEWNSWSTQDRRLLFEAGNGVSGSAYATSGNAIVENAWQMVSWAIDFTAPSLVIYRNGAVQNLESGSMVSNIGRNNPNWFMGIMSSDYFMNANVGSLKIWNKVLNSSQILGEYNATKSRYGL